MQPDNAEEQTHEAQPRLGVRTLGEAEPQEADRREAEHRPGDVPTQPADRFVEAVRVPHHVVDAVSDQHAHGGQAQQPPGPRPCWPAERRHTRCD